MAHERTGRLRVLVADDSDQVRVAVVRVLEETFEVVGSVATGRALVDATLTVRPDVIVSDLQMPSLTGLDAMKLLRDAGHHVPFVLLTAVVGNAQEWVEMGVLAVVHKFDLHVELVAAVQSAAVGKIYLSQTTGS